MDPRRPLSDIRVCDVSQNLAGPYCCQILGDLGAEVIKVEPPGGDSARQWGPPFWGPHSTLFLSVNRNKKSLILDVKRPEGRAVLHRIASGCDVFVQASRAGVADRRGFGYEAIRRSRPDVVHMSITAYGDRGPLREAPGYDPLMQAFSGIMSLTGAPDGPPARVGGSVVDYGTGMWAAMAIIAALRTRDRTGEGAKLDTSLLDTSLAWVSYHIMGFLATDRVPARMGSAMESIVPYQAFGTSDGYVMISAGSEGIFRRLCAALGLPELSSDPRFASNPLRVANREELIPILEGATAAFTTRQLLDLLEAHSVPVSPIRDIGEVTRDPQVEAAGMLVGREYRHAPRYREIAMPARFDGERPAGTLAPPDAGEHTVEILTGAGLSDEEIHGLLESGVAQSPTRGGATSSRHDTLSQEFQGSVTGSGGEHT